MDNESNCADIEESLDQVILNLVSKTVVDELPDGHGNLVTEYLIVLNVYNTVSQTEDKTALATLNKETFDFFQPDCKYELKQLGDGGNQRYFQVIDEGDKASA
jgi:hypothetical protein